MDNRWVLRMQIVEPIEQVERPAQHCRYRKDLAALEDLGHVLALDVLHHEKMTAVLGKVIGDVREYRMMQTVQKTSFAFERLCQVRVAVKRFLDRYDRAELLVNRTIYGSH